MGDICVVGGAGHVGLPLSLAFTQKGRQVRIYDTDDEAVAAISGGEMPFMEADAGLALSAALAEGKLKLSTDPKIVSGVASVVMTIGTPVDEFLNPTRKEVESCLQTLLPYLADEQLLVLRSTVYPGVTQWVSTYLREHGCKAMVAFCPERIVQGKALAELATLPQIVSGTTPHAVEAARELFEVIAPSVVVMQAREAELAKLFSNAYRYIEFAVANQFYAICEAGDVDFYAVMAGLQKDYPRAANIPKAGLAAGPRLFKDTMQLAAYYKNQFSLGHAAVLINEGFPSVLIDMLERAASRKAKEIRTVGLLGMAFKAQNDDPRASLSYKLKKELRLLGYDVLTTDPYVRGDAEILDLYEVLERSQAVVLCAPHAVYKKLLIPADRVVVDVWNFW